MRHDESFKILLQLHPAEVVQAFAPELAAEFGDPAGVQVESVEVLPRVKGLRRSRFIDFAVTVRWPDRPGADGQPTASRAVLILTEHFSSPVAVDMSRVALYTAAMMHRHPGVPVLPVVIVSRTGRHPVPNRLRNRIGGFTALDFRCRLFLVERDCLPAWDKARSPILAVLSALLRDQPAHRIAYHATMRLRASRDGLRHLEALLPLIQTLANLSAESLAEFHALLREEPEMVSVIDLFRAEGKAEGKAEGMAEGTAKGKAEAFIAMILEFHRDGVLTTDQARIRLQHLAEQRQITPEQLAAALASLG